MTGDTNLKRCYVDAELHAALKVRAARERMSMQDYIDTRLRDETHGLDSQLYQQIEFLAAEQNMSPTDYISEILKNHIASLRTGK